MRLLTAHAAMVASTAGELGPHGAPAARETLIELVSAVIRGAADHGDPRVAPALVRAAKRIADERLDQPGLDVGLLARELNVSVRTLQRAFAASGEPVSSWIRRQRLDRARRDLAAPAGRSSISEIAARWCFADSAHFSRTFKRRYGMSPTDYLGGATG